MQELVFTGGEIACRVDFLCNLRISVECTYNITIRVYKSKKNRDEPVK
jgi:hypothetical protein